MGLLLDPPGEQPGADHAGQCGQPEQQCRLGHVDQQWRPRGRIGLPDQGQAEQPRAAAGRGVDGGGRGDQLLAGQYRVAAPGPPRPHRLVGQRERGADQRRVAGRDDPPVQPGQQHRAGSGLDAHGLGHGRQIGRRGRLRQALADQRIGGQALRGAEDALGRVAAELGLGLADRDDRRDQQHQRHHGQLQHQERAGQRPGRPAPHRSASSPSDPRTP